MSNYPYLEKVAWEHPESYGGHSPQGDYVVYARNRDSDCLSESNYAGILEALQELYETPEMQAAYEIVEAKERNPNHDSGGLWESQDSYPFVYDFRAGHWACGWVEYIIVRKDSPKEILDLAESILSDLSDYPVYNEDDFSERERNYADEVWRDCYNVEERIELIKEWSPGTSIFAARRDYLPADDTGALLERMIY